MLVLLLIHDDPGQDARIEAALAVVRATKGELHCVDVAVRPVPPSASFDPYAHAILMQEEDAREAANKKRLTARLDREDIAWRWTDALGEPAECLREFGSDADLIIVSRKLDSFCTEDMAAVATRLIVKSGKPVLAVPEHCSGFEPRGRVLIAWNGSPQADAALRAALPLLWLAREVVLYELQEEGAESHAARARDFLARRGIAVRLKVEPRGDALTDEAIMHAVRTEQAQYLVMGGFGHRPWREAIFGGVTRSILSWSRVPVLLAHALGT